VPLPLLIVIAALQQNLWLISGSSLPPQKWGQQICRFLATSAQLVV